METIQSEGRGVRSVERSLNVLMALIDDDRHDVSLDLIAKRVGLAKSTAHRLLDTLAEAEFVEHGLQPGTYRLGLQAVVLGKAAAKVIRPDERVREVMRRVRDITQETVGLNVRSGVWSVQVTQELSPRALQWNGAANGRLPIHCSAAGKAQLSLHSDEEAIAILEKATLTAYTPKSPSSIAEVMDEVRSTRERGYSLDDEEYQEGLRCIGVPILGVSDADYAVGVSAPASRVDFDEVGETVELLKEAAEALNPLLWATANGATDITGGTE